MKLPVGYISTKRLKCLGLINDIFKCLGDGYIAYLT